MVGLHPAQMLSSGSDDAGAAPRQQCLLQTGTRNRGANFGRAAGSAEAPGRCRRSCSPSGLGAGETRRAGERGSSGSAKSESGQGEIPGGTEADSKTPHFALSDAKQRRKTHPWPPERSGAPLGRCSASWCFKIQKPFKRASCRRASLAKQPLSLLLTLQDSRTALPAALPLPCPPQASIPRPAKSLKHRLQAWKTRQQRGKG